VQGGRAPLVACRCEPLYRVGLAAAAGLVHASYVTMQPYLQHPGYRNTCNKHELCDPGCGRACAAWHAWQYHMHGRHWRLCDRVAREHSTLALMCLVCSKRCLVQGVAHPTRAGTLPPGLAPAGAPLAQHTPACTRRGVSQARGSAQTRQACPRLHHMQPPSTGPVPQAMSRQPSSGQAWVSKSTCVERRPTRYVTGCTGARRWGAQGLLQQARRGGVQGNDQGVQRGGLGHADRAKAERARPHRPQAGQGRQHEVLDLELAQQRLHSLRRACRPERSCCYTLSSMYMLLMCRLHSLVA